MQKIHSLYWLALSSLLIVAGCSHDKKQPEPTPGGSTGVAGATRTAAGTGGTGVAGVPAAGIPAARVPVAGVPAAGSVSAPVAGATTAAGGVGGAAGTPASAGSAGVPIISTGVGGVSSIGGAGAAGVTGAMACTGKSGAKRGKSSESVMAGGQKRTFVYYAPEKLDPNKPVPLVIVPHGYTQSGEKMFSITKYPEVADREGFVAVFPDGAPGSVGPWDVGENVCGNGAFVPGSGDDQEFVDLMIKFADDNQCIDHDHIYMTGWSMGGYLSNHSGCLRDDLRAVGPHSGGAHDLNACKGKRKPVILFHFNPDGLIDYSCGAKARDGWVKRNGCKMDDPEVTAVKGGKCEYYKGCPSDGQVAFCTFDLPPNHATDFLAGHAWSGGTVQQYSIAETESAAELGWSFFKKYAW